MARLIHCPHCDGSFKIVGAKKKRKIGLHYKPISVDPETKEIQRNESGDILRTKCPMSGEPYVKFAKGSKENVVCPKVTQTG